MRGRRMVAGGGGGNLDVYGHSTARADLKEEGVRHLCWGGGEGCGGRKGMKWTWAMKGRCFKLRGIGGRDWRRGSAQEWQIGMASTASGITAMRLCCGIDGQREMAA